MVSKTCWTEWQTVKTLIRYCILQCDLTLHYLVSLFVMSFKAQLTHCGHVEHYQFT